MIYLQRSILGTGSRIRVCIVKRVRKHLDAQRGRHARHILVIEQVGGDLAQTALPGRNALAQTGRAHFAHHVARIVGRALLLVRGLEYLATENDAHKMT